jgi:predicted acyltransferase
MPGAKAQRLASLDAFRGFTIAAMVLVNNPGDWNNIYGPLEHAKWNGWTFTDFVFPFFLFIGGVSMTMSLGRRADEGADKPALLRQLAKRAALIFLIGFALNVVPYFHFSTVRIPGVLQRIALCTLLAAPIVVYFNWRKQLLWIAGLLAVYTAIQLLIPVPDVDGNVVRGALEPGRDVGAWLDRHVFGVHVWKTSKTWDPEGLVSTIPALCSQLFGVLTGRWLATSESARNKAIGLVAGGVACWAVGEAIDLTFMPINKSLWTTSYCIFMTGWALVLFAGFFWLMDATPSDETKKRAQVVFKPFNIYGMNALFIFALSGLIMKMAGFLTIGGRSLRVLMYVPFKALPLSPVNTSLLFAITFNLFMLAIAWGMWRKKWFVKV